MNDCVCSLFTVVCHSEESCLSAVLEGHDASGRYVRWA